MYAIEVKYFWTEPTNKLSYVFGTLVFTILPTSNLMDVPASSQTGESPRLMKH
jgi:hypothetical protein